MLQGRIQIYFWTGVSKRSTVALLCYFLSQWCYFSFLVMKDATRRGTHGAPATVTCATAKSSMDTPVWMDSHSDFTMPLNCSINWEGRRTSQACFHASGSLVSTSHGNICSIGPWRCESKSAMPVPIIHYTGTIV